MKKREQNLATAQEVADLTQQVRDYANTPGHRLPRTRREFLSAGLLSCMTHLAAPSLLSLIGRSAWAQSLGCDTLTGNFPTYINLQLAGGPALYAQHLARGRDGNPLDGYGKLGVGNGPATEMLFSNQAPFWGPDGVNLGSGFLRGLRGRMGTTLFNEIVGNGTAATPGKTAFVAVACESIDDALTNKHDLNGMLSKAGLGGGALPFLLCESGNGNAVNLGVNRFKPAIYDSPAYLRSNSAGAIAGSLGFKGALLGFASERAQNLKVQSEILALINDLAKKEVTSLVRHPQSSASQELLNKIINCAAEKNFANIKAHADTKIDLTAADYDDPAIKAIWDPTYMSNAGFSINFQETVKQQIGMNVAAALRGLSSSCTAVIGGYDYHINQSPGRTATDAKDYYAGDIVARILMTAHQLQQPLFLYISADGSVNSPLDATAPATVAWTGDYFKRGMNYILAYHPTRSLQTGGYVNLGTNYADASFQLNHFTPSGDGDLVVNNDNPIGNKDAQELCAAAVFLNYLSFAGLPAAIDRPELAEVKKKLTDTLPSGESSIFNYYTRIKGVA